MNFDADSKAIQPICGTGCGCGPTRREALQWIGLGAVMALGAGHAMAGPFENTDPDAPGLVPADKKLSPQWIKSLYERGMPTIYRGTDLKYIGMPVGGITTGQLYLGGDGKLWHWDIFNQHMATGADHYAHPPVPASPLEQGFAIKLGGQSRSLDAQGFTDVSFSGQYPIGTVTYADPQCPVAVTLEAFSPFIPLNVDDSSLPATVMHFTMRNTSHAPLEAMLTGTLENAICLNNRQRAGLRHNRVLTREGFSLLECSAGMIKDNPASTPATQPDVVFEDWNKEKYDGWAVEGTAFGIGPIKKSAMPDYQGDVGGATQRVVNSHATAPGDNLGAKDDATGKLTSRNFKIERNFIQFWIGGGNHKDKTCINLLVNGKRVHTATGKNDNKLALQEWDVRRYKGMDAVLEIVDTQKGDWGNIGVGKITFSDRSAVPTDLDALSDFGTMALALLGAAVDESSCDMSVDLPATLVGTMGRKIKLDAGQTATVTFVLAWHFPNLQLAGVKASKGRHYATRFDSAGAVAEHIAKNFDRLYSQTKLWRDTWYDSTLPYWFLDRTFLNASILATSTAYRFADGRFYGWEGVVCCAGTCTHVWQYEQAMGRLFPELDILLRERADFDLNIGFHQDGMIDHRGEFHAGQAVDGQAGTILRAYRDHQMSADAAFLKRNWPSIKKAMQWLIKQDGNNDGILEGAQHNTLDAQWYGPVAWLSGLYLAALRACQKMAQEMPDDDFAHECQTIVDVGVPNFVKLLFDGEYFINRPDAKRPDAINSGSGCEIDQVFGQSWAFQVGLGRLLPQKETRSALQALWKYNFSPDVGPYRKVNKPGRWYAMPGEAGLLMCTFPHADWDYQKAKGKGSSEWAAMYFNECMNGFEHQVAGHMIWEGMVQEGLAVERAIHDRYHAARRNPWNEVECGDHYARSMASFGVFTAACGYEYHGPKGHLGFSPRLTTENFQAAFVAAEGWGSFQQKCEAGTMRATVAIKYGRLQLATLALACKAAGGSGSFHATRGLDSTAIKVHATVQSQAVDCTARIEGTQVVITFAQRIILETGQELAVLI